MARFCHTPGLPQAQEFPRPIQLTDIQCDRMHPICEAVVVAAHPGSSTTTLARSVVYYMKGFSMSKAIYELDQFKFSLLTCGNNPLSRSEELQAQ